MRVFALASSSDFFWQPRWFRPFLAPRDHGNSFYPFDLFDGLVRILPGTVITFGIDTMVRLLMFLRLNLSDSQDRGADPGDCNLLEHFLHLGPEFFSPCWKSRILVP